MGVALKKSDVEEPSSPQPGMDTKPEELLGEPEPWEPWETKLCLWSIGIGIAGLVVLGILVNQLILGK